MNESYLPILLQLRLLVGFLGERAQFSWWPTAFYEPSSKLFLEPVFSKSSRLAQYHGVLEAARRLHDEHLNVSAYHLFRLPEEIEQDLHELLLSNCGEDLSSQIPQDKEAALDMLKGMSDGKPNSSVGPIAIGNMKDIEADGTLRMIACTYMAAFARNTKTYPYLTC